MRTSGKRVKMTSIIAKILKFSPHDLKETDDSKMVRQGIMRQRIMVSFDVRHAIPMGYSPANMTHPPSPFDGKPWICAGP
tara:strand:+ start:272 stop:511 length:240 start_codon:yes stop_codon:yes gene_type:complete